MAKIGIDAFPLQFPMTGVGNYLYLLLKELLVMRKEDSFFLYFAKNNPILEGLSSFPHVTLRPSSFLSRSQALWSQTTLTWMAFRDNLDLFWGATQSLPLFARKKQKNLLTIYDFTYLLYPEASSFIRGHYLRLLSHTFYRRADARIAISKGTSQRLKELYSLLSDAIVLPPLKPIEMDEKTLGVHGLIPKRYYVMVGTLEPRKNIVPALEAYSEALKEERLDPLVLIGKKGWKDKRIQQTVENLSLRHPHHLKVVGYLPDRQLNALIHGAKALVMPSIYEGYGMPLAEARAMGTPVIACALPEMMEAAEDDGLFIDPTNFKIEFQRALRVSLSPPGPCHYPTVRELALQLSQEIDRLLVHGMHK